MCAYSQTCFYGVCTEQCMHVANFGSDTPFVGRNALVSNFNVHSSNQSLMFWFKMDGSSLNDNYLIKSNFSVDITLADTDLLEYRATDGVTYNSAITSGQPDFGVGYWYHIAITSMVGREVSFWINGQLYSRTSRTAADTTHGGANALNIFAGMAGFYRFMRVYNNTLLNTSMVQAAYANQNILDGALDIAPFNDGSFPVTHDLSGNANTWSSLTSDVTFRNCPADFPDAHGCANNSFLGGPQCGYCGLACPITCPHCDSSVEVPVGCFVGRCQIFACQIGWVDCNDQVSDGCESPSAGGCSDCVIAYPDPTTCVRATRTHLMDVKRARIATLTTADFAGTSVRLERAAPSGSAHAPCTGSVITVSNATTWAAGHSASGYHVRRASPIARTPSKLHARLNSTTTATAVFAGTHAAAAKPASEEPCT